MNIILWILQAILAIKLLTVVFDHGLFRGKPDMATAIQKLGEPARPLLSAAALVSFLAALGLILPGLLGFPSQVTSLVAGFCVFILLASISLHVESREKPKIFVSLVLAAFAIVVVIGRW